MQLNPFQFVFSLSCLNSVDPFKINLLNFEVYFQFGFSLVRADAFRLKACSFFIILWTKAIRNALVFSDILIKSLNLKKCTHKPQTGKNRMPSAKVQLHLMYIAHWKSKWFQSYYYSDGHFRKFTLTTFTYKYNVVETTILYSIIMTVWSKWNSLTENLLF